jgi:hypothetical protein
MTLTDISTTARTATTDTSTGGACGCCAPQPQAAERSASIEDAVEKAGYRLTTA